MDKENRNTLIVLGIVLLLFVGVYGGISAYSGVNPPFTVINSGSMQHSQNESSIGTIDTGDMVIVKDPDSKGIVTYVEGEKSGYSSFGEYGDVIIYKKESSNIIHRAMIFMELKEVAVNKVVWYVPSLKDYDDWKITATEDFNSYDCKNLVWDNNDCTLTFNYIQKSYCFWLTDVGYSRVNVSINLFDLAKNQNVGYSGYLTKGDNGQTNRAFDQSCTIFENKLVEPEIIKSVAAAEIPWIGCIKLIVKGNTDSIPKNSITDLVLLIVGFIALLIAINVILSKIDKNKTEIQNKNNESNKNQRRNQRR